MHNEAIRKLKNLEIIQSKDNPLVKKLKGIQSEVRAYQMTGELWLEGEHLCAAAFDKGLELNHLICSDAQYGELSQKFSNWFESAKKVSLIQDALLKSLSSLPSPTSIGFLVQTPTPLGLDPLLATVVLDRVQDAGNVGSVLRSAAAFGFRQVIALQGTAGLWSNKVVRSAMGAHFSLRLVESSSIDAIMELKVPLLCTSSHLGEYLHQLQKNMKIPFPCAWIFGHEGQGVRQELMELASMRVRIAQPGGEESLNIAAASAVCLYASSTNQI